MHSKQYCRHLSSVEIVFCDCSMFYRECLWTWKVALKIDFCFLLRWYVTARIDLCLVGS